MRVVEEEIDAVEFHAADIGFRGEIEHGVEVDERLGAGGAFADETGPGCVVEFGEVIGGHIILGGGVEVEKQGGVFDPPWIGKKETEKGRGGDPALLFQNLLLRYAPIFGAVGFTSGPK